jgi:hypothetical protein
MGLGLERDIEEILLDREMEMLVESGGEGLLSWIVRKLYGWNLIGCSFR